MDLSKYSVGTVVRVDLTIEKYYYVGKIVEVDSNSLSLVDKNGQLVMIKADSISFIREVKNG